MVGSDCYAEQVVVTGVGWGGGGGGVKQRGMGEEEEEGGIGLSVGGFLWQYHFLCPLLS